MDIYEILRELGRAMIDAHDEHGLTDFDDIEKVDAVRGPLIKKYGPDILEKIPVNKRPEAKLLISLFCSGEIPFVKLYKWIGELAQKS